MRLLSIVFFPCALLFLSLGCSTVSTSQLEQVPSQIERGSTTKAEVIAMLGEPDHRSIDPSGETWTYGGAQQQSAEQAAVGQAIGIGSGFIPVPYVGTAINSVRTLGRTAQTSKPGATISFDKAGVVKDYRVEIP